MKQLIEKAVLTIDRQKSGSREFEPYSINVCRDGTEYCFGTEEASAILKITRQEHLLFGKIKLNIKNEAFRENDNLSMGTPVTISLSLKHQPKRMTAMYLHRDWWTRPKFVEDISDIPERTQSLYLEYEDGAGYLLPMAGESFKTMAGSGKPGALTLTMTAYMGGANYLEEPVFILTAGNSVTDAVHRAFELAAEIKGVPMKNRKRYPELFEYLGWCSWDAFYTDINEEKVRAKAAELVEKQIPVRWFLMDDGWLSVHEQRLYDFMPEKKKFPRGFKEMIRDIRETSHIDWFGVWHAFGGYWGGIQPGSELEKAQKEHLIHTIHGKVLPHPTAEKGYGFFRDWYEKLREEGINFIKVDGQSAIKNYYENTLPVCRAAKGSHSALEGAAAVYMEGNLINCMGMAMENILGRPGSVLSRNSDDFMPDNETGFTEHLLQNAYNALYHDELYYGDWDMFWTCHPDAVKHGILRAVSGGPVYISDRIQDTAADTLVPLVYQDGRILRMDRMAKPSPDCIFTNPEKEGLLKLTNIADSGTGNKAGAVAVYNLGSSERTGSIGIDDIYDLEGGEFYLYDYLSGAGRTLSGTGREEISIAGGGYGLYLALPVKDGISVIGLLDKYISFHAVAEVVYQPGAVQVVLRQAGEFGFYSVYRVTGITVNGKNITDQLKKEGGLYKTMLDGNGRQLVTIALSC